MSSSFDLLVALAQLGLEGLVLWRVSAGAFFALIWFSILHPTSRPFILAMLGVFPERAAGLYTVVVVVNLIECAQLLAQATYSRLSRAGGQG